ncbi:MAG: flagellar basal body P-ring formation chaperone FlgA [Pseudomonadota bacterium]
MQSLIALLALSVVTDVTAVRSLDRGQIIEEADIEGDGQEVLNFVGRAVRRPIGSGRTIRRYDTQAPKDVIRQQGVAVLFVRGPLTLRTEGRAMDSGSVGDRINIALKGRRQPLSAIIVAPGRVEVRP